MRFSCVVEGRARPKGSLSRGRYGGLHDRPVVKQWIATCVEQLKREHKRSGLPVFDSLCNVALTFHMRPASTTGWILADLDKLCRGVFDALTHAGVWTDDVLAKSLVATKLNVEENEVEHVEVTLYIPT